MKSDIRIEEPASNRAMASVDESDTHGEALATLALFALGSLPPDEQSAVDRHLAAGCARCAHALRAYLRVASALGAAIASVPPSMLGKRRVKRRVRQAAHAT